MNMRHIALSALACIGTAHANDSNVWWNPARPGRAIAIEDQGNVRVAILFDYAEDGRPTWLVADDLRFNWDGDYSTLYRVVGPSADAPRAGPSSIVPIGSMWLGLFYEAPAIQYSVDGQSIWYHVQPYVFGKGPVCHWVLDPSIERSSFHGVWWNPEEPGWAIQISDQTSARGRTIFALLAIYDANRESTWVVASDVPKGADGTFAGKVHRTRMPPRTAPPQLVPDIEEVGTIAFAFRTATTGEVTYTLDGVTISKPIQRYFFGEQPAICEIVD